MKFIEYKEEIIESLIFACADNSIRKMALSIGAISFLEKPFELKTLISEITKGLKLPKFPT